MKTQIWSIAVGVVLGMAIGYLVYGGLAIGFGSAKRLPLALPVRLVPASTAQCLRCNDQKFVPAPPWNGMARNGWAPCTWCNLR